MRTPFTGCGTALVTPFTASGSVDEAGVRRLGRRQIDAGVHFLVPVGTTGESPTLTLAERLRIVEIIVDEADGRVPILAGAGGYDTREVIEVAAEMKKAGADGLLSVTPYYNRPTQDGLFQHFRAIAESTTLPIVVYNVPGRTGCNVEPPTLVRLSSLPNVVGVKEASGNMSQMCDVCRAVPDDFIVLSGDDVVTLPLMAVGGRGIISVVSNEVPAEMSQLVEAAERGDYTAALRDSPAHHAADADQFRGIEPGSAQDRDGRDGAAGGDLPAAAGRAAVRIEREDPQGADRPQSRQQTRFRLDDPD